MVTLLRRLVYVLFEILAQYMPAKDPSYQRYKSVRNALRKWEPISVVGHIITALHKAHTGGVEVVRYYQPWNLLLLLKWTFQEIDLTAHRRPPATLNDVNKIVNFSNAIVGPLPTDYPSLTLFLRRLSIQQHWLHHIDGAAIARQEILFGQLSANHTFKQQFAHNTGMAVDDFLDLSFALLSLTLANPSPTAVTQENFGSIAKTFPAGTVQGFFKFLSRTPNELNVWLNESAWKDVTIEDQQILPSPFLRAPLLEFGPQYLIYFPPLLCRSIELSIYRTVRSEDVEKFMQRFGPLFENYLGQCLTNAGVIAADEKTLQAQLPDGGKCVDFIVLEPEASILIDAKGIELSTLGRVAQSEEQLYKSVKESAIKAIFQGLHTHRRISLSPVATQYGRAETYMLVVTFEPLNFGPSNELKTTFGPMLINALASEFGENLPFPLENVYFCSIREFEDLLERVRAKSTTFVTALRHAKKNDESVPTRKFTFSQHLEELGSPGIRLPMLSAALDRIETRCAYRLADSG